MDVYLIIFDSEDIIHFDGASKRGWDDLKRESVLDCDYYNKAVDVEKIMFNENHVYY